MVRTPPRERYLAREVGRLAGVSGTTVGQWARHGYIRSSVSDGEPRVYAARDVAEAAVVHELLARGVTHRTIRHAIDNLRARYGAWPLTNASLATAPGGRRTRVVLQEHEADYDVGDRGWQQVIESEPLNEIDARPDLATAA